MNNAGLEVQVGRLLSIQESWRPERRPVGWHSAPRVERQFLEQDLGNPLVSYSLISLKCNNEGGCFHPHRAGRRADGECLLVRDEDVFLHSQTQLSNREYLVLL